MPLIGELTVTCLPDVSSGEVFAMDFPVDDGVSCLATNTMKIKKASENRGFRWLLRLGLNQRPSD